MRLIREIFDLNHWLIYVVLPILGGTVYGQQISCSGTSHIYRVDQTENGGEGTTGSTYSWQVVQTEFQGTISPITFSGNQIELNWAETPEGTYTLIVTESQGNCQESKQLTILLRNEIEMAEIPDKIICGENGEVTFSAGFGFETYTWYNQTGNVLGNSRELTVTEPGIYTIEVTSGSCTSTQSVEALEIEFPEFTVNTDQFGTIIVDHIGGNVENFVYQLEDMDGNVIRDWQVSNTFTQVPQGIYIVRIHPWDNTCMTFITASTITIPNFFSPNHDGINDTWDLSRLMDYAPDAKVEIYDRYGKLFKILSQHNGFIWDGIYLNKPVPTTTYYYILHYKNERLTGVVNVKNR